MNYYSYVLQRTRGLNNKTVSPVQVQNLGLLSRVQNINCELTLSQRHGNKQGVMLEQILVDSQWYKRPFSCKRTYASHILPLRK